MLLPRQQEPRSRKQTSCSQSLNLQTPVASLVRWNDAFRTAYTCEKPIESKYTEKQNDAQVTSPRIINTWARLEEATQGPTFRLTIYP